MAILAFKGHETRGREVIRVLEMLGGKERIPGILDGNAEISWYYINENGYIDFKENVLFDYDNTVVFTLEEFLEKYPYKVGDNVYNIIHNESQTITKLAWDTQENEVVYQTDNNEYVYVNYLQPYKEETIEGEITCFKVLESYCADEVKIEFDSSKFEMVERDNSWFVVKKKPNYPKTYEECCKVLTVDPDNCLSIKNPYYDDGEEDTTNYEQDILSIFNYLWKLRICRDAYRKIAGEQMGLDKSWEPDWKKEEERKYCIVNTQGEITKWVQKTTNKILTFPTEEIRDTFYENFKGLIEECKELL